MASLCPIHKYQLSCILIEHFFLEVPHGLVEKILMLKDLQSLIHSTSIRIWLWVKSLVGADKWDKILPFKSSEEKQLQKIITMQSGGYG